MKRVTLAFDQQWILKIHNSSNVLPKQAVQDSLSSLDGVSVTSMGFTQVQIDISSNDESDVGRILRKVKTALTDQYQIDSSSLNQVMTVRIFDIEEPDSSGEVQDRDEDVDNKTGKDRRNEDAENRKQKDDRREDDGKRTGEDSREPMKNDSPRGRSDQTQSGDSQVRQAAPSAASVPSASKTHGYPKNEDDDDSSDSIDDILKKARALKGASQFAALCEHISKLAPLLIKRGIERALAHQTFLFSVDSGYGCTTACTLLAKLFKLTGLVSLKNTNPSELVLPALTSPDDLKSLPGQISYSKGKLLCLDITNIISEVSSEEFRQILTALQDINDKSVIVFRVPYLEQAAIDSLCQSIADILNVRPVSFVPLSADQLMELARDQLSSLGFEVQKDAWELFRRRIEFEKSDGRFYGVHTVDKIVDEMLLCKMDQVLLSGDDNNMITARDLDDLVAGILNQDEDPEKSLKEMVGIDAIRQSLEQIMNQIEFSRKNGNVAAPSMHMRFLGNPGTGKTTVARYLGAIFHKKGLLSRGYFIEHAGGDFLGKYVGHTAPKVISICRDAYGSVLFIDEAYTLADADYHGSNSGFAREAINTLLAQMENHRENMVVIMAGYPDDMERLNAINPGLSSRIPYTLNFPNYSREQLAQIFMQMVRKSRFVPSDDLENAVVSYFDRLGDDVLSAKNFSNARFVRNLFERAWSKTITRVQMSGIDLYQITAEDFSAAANEDAAILNKVPEKKRSIGFGKRDSD